MPTPGPIACVVRSPVRGVRHFPPGTVSRKQGWTRPEAPFLRGPGPSDPKNHPFVRVWFFSFSFLSPLSKTAWRPLLPLSPRQFQGAHLVLAEVMAVILLMGSKTDGPRCPKCRRQAELGRPRGGEGKCCRNTPSFGALLGLERAAALAKTCFCQQKPHFTNIQQQQKPVNGKKTLKIRLPCYSEAACPLRAEVFSLVNSGFK